MTDLVERLRMPHFLSDSAIATIRAERKEAADEIERLRKALAIISYMDCQNGEDAMKMRSIATDVTMWERPDSMWWYGKDYGPKHLSQVRATEPT